MAAPIHYPVTVTGHLDQPARWRWLYKWFLALPHLLVLVFLWLAFVVLTLVAGVGIAIALVGGFLILGGRLPFGRLPGDISVQGQSGSFFFPIVSCIIISLVLTVVLNVIIRR